MSYNDEQVKTKLSVLADSQESIESIGQWVLFHRRHAPRTVTLWAQQVKDSSPAKRLNLIYLANEVIQQSRIKKKDDFLEAFTPIIADSLAVAYADATREVQHKLRRVIQVWRDRSIFSPATIQGIEAKVNEVDRTRSTKRAPLGGSLFSGSTSGAAAGVPNELVQLAKTQGESSKAAAAAADNVQSALQAYNALPATAEPSQLPAHSAQLSQQLKQLDATASAVQASMTTRETLIAQLQTLLSTNQAALAKEQSQSADLAAKRDALSARKTAAEDAIMSSAPGSFAPPAYPDAAPDQARPDVEALTPPAIESFTPPPDDVGDGARTPPGEPSPYARQLATPGAGADGAVSRDPRRRPVAAEGGAAVPAKRRKITESDVDEFIGDVLEGIDADVVGMLG